MANILLIDDDPEFGKLLQENLSDLGHDVRWHELPDEALAALSSGLAVQLIFLDNKMPRMSGLEFLEALRDRGIVLPVILITSEPDDQTAIDAMKRGAFDYVVKPLDDDRLMGEVGPVLEEALRVASQPRRVVLPGPSGQPADDPTIVGRSKAIVRVFKEIARATTLDEPVLILGETGTGKDLVARAIHTNTDRRRDKPFVPVNCSALPEQLGESVLFGHERGAFTGAEKARKGRFEHADGGTIFLDEIGDMPLELQAKLLRVLQNREIERVGNDRAEPIKVDVRVLAATHRDLHAMVRRGTFREDLLFRLDGMRIHLPPLRDRREDIDLLADRFLDRLTDQHGREVIHPSALDRLREHDWPGNVRQLQKVLCRAIASCRGPQIMPENLDFGESVAGHDGPDELTVAQCLRRAVELAWAGGGPKLLPTLAAELESELLRVAVERNKTLRLSQDDLARRVGMARATLWKRLREYGLQPPASDESGSV